MSTYVELEIKNLLNEIDDVEIVANRLIEHLESSPDLLTQDNINAICRFLLSSQNPARLINFVLKHIDNETIAIPWPYFLEAIGIINIELDETTLAALVQGVQEDNAQSEAARSQKLTHVLPALQEWRTDRKFKIHKEYLNSKNLLLDQLVTLRTQQLYEQEKQLLKRLQKLYPGDPEIRQEVSEHKQRYALDVLQRRSPRSRSINENELAPKDPAVEQALSALLQSLLEHVEKSPEMAFDFAVVAFMLESYETALQLLSYSDENPSLLWFRLEILLKSRHFIELLNELAHVELTFADDPETFFATAYLRAQALWGLGQKHTAVEVMEGLVAARPHYRAASALLSIWSTK